MAKKRSADTGPHTRSAKAKAQATLVSSRTAYLRATVPEVLHLQTAAEARREKARLERTFGTIYRVTGKGGTDLKLSSVSTSLVNKSSEMKRIRRDLKSASNRATGKKAKALVDVGYRENFWDWAVGETNED